MSQGRKFTVKNYIFLEDKFDIIEINNFNMLKLIFTCESCTISFTK